MWFLISYVIYILLFIVAAFSSLAGGLESRADVAFVVMATVVWLAGKIVDSAPGDNPDADKFDYGQTAEIFCLVLPAVTVIIAVLVLLIGYAYVCVPIAATLLLLASRWVYRQEKLNWTQQ